jgi:hypothetical protein
MRNTAIARSKRISRRWIAAALLACVLLGVGVAALTRPASLLAGAQNGPPQLADVWRQLYHAKLVDTEACWLAAAHYPGARPYCHNLAKQGLVYFYLRKHAYKKAIEPLDDLAAQDDFQAFGIAGLVVVYTNLGEDEKANDANGRLTFEMRQSLSQQSPQMYQLFSKALDELAERAI